MAKSKCPLGCPSDECFQPQPCHQSASRTQKADAKVLLKLQLKYRDLLPDEARLDA